jgi:hypothetical protein
MVPRAKAVLNGRMEDFSRISSIDATLTVLSLWMNVLTDGFIAMGFFHPKTRFKHPAYSPPDVIWASMQYKSKQCVGGHITGNVFYVY